MCFKFFKCGKDKNFFINQELAGCVAFFPQNNSHSQSVTRSNMENK